MTTADRFLMAGVMGWPVMQSRSPLLHNYWMAQQGLAGTYVPLAIKPGTLAAALKGLHPLGFAGCNLTIPHKQAALSLADEASDTARAIGAANTLLFEPSGRIVADNTDAPALLRALPISARGKSALVLGAGGSARAAVWARAVSRPEMTPATTGGLPC